MVPSSLGIDWPTPRPTTTAVAPRRRGAQRRVEGRDAGRVRAPAARRAEVEQVADLLGAGVAKALLGKDVLSDELPWVTGVDRPARHPAELRDDDGLRHAAHRRVELPLHPVPARRSTRRARCRSTSTRTLIGMRYPYEVNLVGDAAATLRALIPLLQRKADRSLARGHRGRRRPLVGDDGRRRPRSRPTRSTRCGCSRELSPRLPDDAIVTADSGSSANWYARQLQVPRPACAARCRAPWPRWAPACRTASAPSSPTPTGRSIVFAGDGAMQMNGLAELITIKRYWQEWADPRLVVAVLHNNDLNQVTWEMRAMGGAPKFVESQALPDVDYAGLRRAASGLHGDRGRQARTRSGRPGTGRWPPTGPPCSTCAPTRTCRPIPPHATFEQMKDAAVGAAAGRRGPLGGRARRASRPSSRSSCRTGTGERWPAFVCSARHSSRGPAEHSLDRMVRNVEHGRFERSLSGLTAASALVTGVEIYLEHYKAQLRQQVDVEPGRADPAAGGGRDRRGVLPTRGRRPRCRSRPGSTPPNGLLGEYFHARGVARKPGGWRLCVLQPADGAADLGARADGHGRRDGPARRGAAPGEVMADARDRIVDRPATTCPTSGPAGEPPHPVVAAPPAPGHHARR